MTLTKGYALAMSIGLVLSELSLSAGTATQLVFASQPTNIIAGGTLTNVAVQLVDKQGTNVAQSGVAISLALNKTGLGGATNVATDANGRAAFTNLIISLAGSGEILTAASSGLKSAVSSNFTVSKGSTAVALTSSTNCLVYGQSVTFTALVSPVAPAAGVPTGTVTFKDGSVTLGTATLAPSGIATFSTNRISAATTNRLITAAYGGDANFLAGTSSNWVQAAVKLSLTVSGVIANSKIYDGTTNAALNFTNAALNNLLPGDVVTLNATSAKGAFADKSADAGKMVSVTGLALAGVSAANYAVTPPMTTASITPRNLLITAKGVNKIYDGTPKATVTLADNRLTGDVFTNGYASAAFTNQNVGTAILINVSSLSISGANAGNYSLSNLTATAAANITAATLTVTGIVASNKVYDATTTASLNCSNAQPVTVFAGDAVTLNTAAAKGTFASKYVGIGTKVQVSGLTLAGTNAANYLLTQPATTATITPRSLIITAKGVNKIYDGTTNATVTLTDNRAAGDVFTNRYTSASFVSRNVATNILINVYGVAMTGAVATNYTLAASNLTAFANITKAPLTVAGVTANDKVYDRSTTATLNFSNAALATIFAGDAVTVNTAAAKGVFVSKNVGTNKTVTVSGLLLAGASSNNYSLTQPVTSANIVARSLAITARGVAKIYDGTTNASVSLADNRITGDLLTNSFAFAAFTNKDPGTNILINVYGLATVGPDAPNYWLTVTNTTAATNILRAVLTVAAPNLSRPYAATNPALTEVYSGFAAGESITNSDVTGSPILVTTAATNSNVGAYPITITKGTLASADYNFIFTNGILTVTRADTAALVSTSLNPALTNQNVTFATTVNPVPVIALPVTGVIQFRCNGTNQLGNPVALAGGTANVTVLAAALGQADSVITAEYSDPAGNFNPCTNSVTQGILTVVAPSLPGKMSLSSVRRDGTVAGQIAGTAGQTYVIQASVDLMTWAAISTNVADANGLVWLVDSNTAAFPKRFYRAFSP